MSCRGLSGRSENIRQGGQATRPTNSNRVERAADRSPVNGTSLPDRWHFAGPGQHNGAPPCRERAVVRLTEGQFTRLFLPVTMM